MHSRLSSRIDTNDVQTSAGGAAFSDEEGSIPRFRAEFLGFTSKSVAVWPNLPLSSYIPCSVICPQLLLRSQNYE
jgi:hypothetical protein